jgi:hypothetical protein
MLKKRKRRSDRNHVIYLICNNITQQQYIGLTALSYNGNAKKTIHRRFLKHVQRALTENKAWGLSRNIRHYGPEVFSVTVLHIVRGKAEAHRLETMLIKEQNPALNTFK